MSTSTKHAKPISPSRARRDREKTETRALILKAARELFTTEGYAQTSMRRIADQIGYTATALILVAAGLLVTLEIAVSWRRELIRPRSCAA